MAGLKVALVTYFKQPLEKQAREVGLKIDNKNPDVVLALGGEGTFLVANQKYPTKPRLQIYHNSACRNCKVHNFKKILMQLNEGKYDLRDEVKLRAVVNNNPRKGLAALNDINIHYIPPTALRFKINAKDLNENIIGDGVVIATPHGAPAYFKSITGKTFNKGIGIAINNPTKSLKSKIVPTGSKIKVSITRGPGVLAADCQKRLIPLKTNDVVTITESNTPAKLVILQKRGEKLQSY